MDRLNQPNQSGKQGTIGERQYRNKPLQQPIKPVRPGQNRTPNQNNIATNIQMQSRQQGTTQQQRVVKPIQQQKGVQQQQRVTQQQQQATQQQQKVVQQVVNQQVQQVNKQQQRAVQPIQRRYNTQQLANSQSSSINNTERHIQGNDNYSLAGKPKLTRLQREAQGLPSRNIIIEQTSGNIPLQQQRDYDLCNNNADSFKVKQVKKEGIGFLVLPLSLIVLLIVIIIIILGNVILSINDMKINTTSLLNSKSVTKEEFIEAAENKDLQIENKELGGGITEVMAYTDDYSYEINYITFESTTDAQAYYNYIIDGADETESSVSSSIVGQNSAESTFISSTYNGFMDITYIDNTIIIAIAYDSNKQTDVISFMNSLGY